jgi:hypothetical protein
MIMWVFLILILIVAILIHTQARRWSRESYEQGYLDGLHHQLPNVDIAGVKMSNELLKSLRDKEGKSNV